mgnify:CR=1 FL=1
MRKKILSAILCATMALTALTGCSSEGKEDVPSVYYMNFKPEVTEVWEEIAEAYTEETGIPVKVVTAAGGNYESTLKSEIVKSDAPTLFQINGPIGYQAWKDYCADLSETQFYNALSDKELAIKGADGGVYGVPYTIEGYGIIYNLEIMNKYFAMDGAVVTSIDKINSFETLKAVVEDMQAKKDALGIKGVFASTSLLPGEEWRWNTHLANLPINAEYVANNVSDMEEITFSHGENFKNIFDLYLNNSTADARMLGSKGVNDSMAEFALGQCAMVQNGNWGSSQVLGVSGNTVKSEDIKFMPIYMDLDGEENQGLCIGTENFLCINKKATEEEQKNAIDFLEWLYLSDKGKEYVRDKLKFISPFESSDSSKMTDPLALEVVKWLENKSVNNIPWSFTIIPSTTFKNEFGANLLKYSQEKMTWSDLEKAFNSKWKSEWDLLIK